MTLHLRSRTALICMAAALLPFAAHTIEPSATVKVTPLLKTTQTWNGAPILAAFPIAAYGKDNQTSVVDVTDFFAGDTPALSGLSTAARRTGSAHRAGLRAAPARRAGRSRCRSPCRRCGR